MKITHLRIVIISWLCICLKSADVVGQSIGINAAGNMPDSSAILDLSSSTQGLLFPRMNTTERDSIPFTCSCTPAQGLIIFNTTTLCLEMYLDGSWHSVSCPTTCVPPEMPAPINGNNIPCENVSGENYNISSVNNATTYTWTVPPGATITSGQGTTSVYVDFTTVNGDISVTANNGCGSSAPQILNVNSLLVTPDPISGPANLGTHTGVTYSVPSIPNVISYNWTVPSGATITAGQGTESITVDFSCSASGDIQVVPVTTCGNGNAQTLNVTAGVPSAPSGSTNIYTQTQIEWHWDPVTGATGYKYNTIDDSSSATDNGTNTSYSQSGFTCNTTYTLYVWAYNDCGNSPVSVLTQTTFACCPVWMPLTTNVSPAVRYGHASSWDPTNNKMLIFGGINNSVYFNDLWAYDPSTNTWTQLNPGGGPPSTRTYHSAVWDAANNRMLVFGGYHSGTFLNDLWAYSPSGNLWTQITPIGGLPAGRGNHVAVWDDTNNRMLIFGGTDGSPRSDLWSYSPSGNTWTQLNPSGSTPSARRYFSGVWDAANSRMLIFGGEGSGPLNDLWAFSGNSWTQLTPTGGLPSARAYHSACWDASNNTMLVFGGISSSTPRNELWSYSPSANSWSLLTSNAPPPAARYLQSTVFDNSNNRMLMFGGISSTGILNDLWSYCP